MPQGAREGEHLVAVLNRAIGIPQAECRQRQVGQNHHPWVLHDMGAILLPRIKWQSLGQMRMCHGEFALVKACLPECPVHLQSSTTILLPLRQRQLSLPQLPHRAQLGTHERERRHSQGRLHLAWALPHGATERQGALVARFHFRCPIATRDNQ
jgi:hypothetical protein